MGRVIKWLFYLIILAAVALTAYAYLGPYFGADFAPEQQQIRVPITLPTSDGS